MPTLSPFFSAGMHTSISEILKEKSLKPSRCSLPCLAQSQTHPNNLSHFLSVPLNPEPKANTNTHSVHASCTNITPQSTGAVIHASTYYCCYKYRHLTYTTLHTHSDPPFLSETCLNISFWTHEYKNTQ